MKSRRAKNIQSGGRPIDSRVPTRSPATLSDLTVYLTAVPRRCSLTAVSVRLRRALGQDARKAKCPTELTIGHFVLATSYSRTACRRTTIGAAAFHFRVRNGNGWCHCAIITRVRNRTGGFAAFAAAQARSRISGDIGRLSSIASTYNQISKELSTLSSQPSTDGLIR